MTSPANAMGPSSTLLPPAGAMSMPETERVFFEDRLGADFTHVRVHTDQAAAGAAESLGAKAFTVGNDIAFAEGRYEPGTTEGRRLLAHELIHVAQQSRGGAASTDAEPRADAAAERAAEGSSISPEAQGTAAEGVYCDEDEKKKDDVTPAPQPLPSPQGAAGGVSFGAAGLQFPGLSAGFQLQKPQLTPPAFGTGAFAPGSLGVPPLSFPGSSLPIGAEGPLPLPRLDPQLLKPPSLMPPFMPGSEPKPDWLALQQSYRSRGSTMSDRDAEAIMQTYDMNSQLLNTMGITDRFKFLFITKEWILNMGIEKQVEDTQARENPNARDKADKEWKIAHPDEIATPIIPFIKGKF